MGGMVTVLRLKRIFQWDSRVFTAKYRHAVIRPNASPQVSRNTELREPLICVRIFCQPDKQALYGTDRAFVAVQESPP